MSKRSKTLSFLLCGLGAAALSLAALQARAQATELNLWVMSTTEQQQADMRELLKPFLAANPTLRVNVTVLNWESAWTKITAAAASGQGPDVLELGTTWVPAISSMGALEQISEAQQAEVGGAKAFFPVMWGTTHKHDDAKDTCNPPVTRRNDGRRIGLHKNLEESHVDAAALRSRNHRARRLGHAPGADPR